MELDLEEIKATLARRDERGNDFIAGNTGRAASDRSFMLSQMRPLLEENERLEKERALWESRFQTAAANARLRDAENAALAAWKVHTRAAVASAEKCLREGRAERALAELGRVSS